MHDIQRELRKGAVAAGVIGLILVIIGVLAPGPLVGAAAAPLALPAVVIGGSAAVIGAIVYVMYFWRK